MTEKLVLDQNIICNAIELKNKQGTYDKTSARVIVLIYEVGHKIVCDKFLWKEYKKRIKEKYNKKIKERPTHTDIIIIRRIREILSNPKKFTGNMKKYAGPLDDPIEQDFKGRFPESNNEDLMIARVAAENKVYALITDDTPFHDWIKDVLQSRYDFSGLTPAEALKDAGLELSQN